MPQPILIAEDLGFRYPTRIKPALRGLNFRVEAGETILLLGSSGSGKSTLALCLDGLIPHLIDGERSGEVTVAGLVVGDTPVHILARETGLVFQDPESQFCTLTVEDEVAFGLENLCIPAEEIEPAIDAALAEVGLPGFRSRRLDTLSGGEKQRVALAAVLAMGPRILVLDEPSANLDPRATAELFALLKKLGADGRHTIIIIEHRLDQIIDWIDRVLVLGDEGALLLDGAPSLVFYDRAFDLEQMGIWLPQTVELVHALREAGWRIDGCPLSVGETAAAAAAAPGLIERLVEQTAVRPPRSAAGTGVDFALRAEHLAYSYPNGFEAVGDVSLAIPRGGFVAIAGGNGAGKTTLASLLTGLLSPANGKVLLEGEDASRMSAQAISERIGLVFQNPEHQFVTDTVFGELAFSVAPRPGRRKAGKLNPVQHVLVNMWLERLGLRALAEANPYTLSQGQKRRLSVGSMLIRGQSVLVLDEPTIGQDELQCRRLMEMMNDIRIDKRSVLMITHDMRLVAENADLLIVLSRGRVAYSGAPADFFAHPDQVEAAGLAMPPLGQLSHHLGHSAGVTLRLTTLEEFVWAAGGQPPQVMMGRR